MPNHQIWPKGAPRIESCVFPACPRYSRSMSSFSDTERCSRLTQFVLSPSSRISYFSRELWFCLVGNVINLGFPFAQINRCYIWLNNWWDNGYQNPLKGDLWRISGILPSSFRIWISPLKKTICFTKETTPTYLKQERTIKEMYLLARCTASHCHTILQEHWLTFRKESTAWAKVGGNTVPPGDREEIRLVGEWRGRLDRVTRIILFYQKNVRITC